LVGRPALDQVQQLIEASVKGGTLAAPCQREFPAKKAHVGIEPPLNQPVGAIVGPVVDDEDEAVPNRKGKQAIEGLADHSRLVESGYQEREQILVAGARRGRWSRDRAAHEP